MTSAAMYAIKARRHYTKPSSPPNASKLQTRTTCTHQVISVMILQTLCQPPLPWTSTSRKRSYAPSLACPNETTKDTPNVSTATTMATFHVTPGRGKTNNRIRTSN